MLEYCSLLPYRDYFYLVLEIILNPYKFIEDKCCIAGPPFLDWLLAGETEYVFDDAIAESDIVKIKVCIPKDLFDERPRRRVASNNRKVEICSLVD